MVHAQGHLQWPQYDQDHVRLQSKGRPQEFDGNLLGKQKGPSPTLAPNPPHPLPSHPTQHIRATPPPPRLERANHAPPHTPLRCGRSVRSTHRVSTDGPELSPPNLPVQWCPPAHIHRREARRNRREARRSSDTQACSHVCARVLRRRSTPLSLGQMGTSGRCSTPQSLTAPMRCGRPPSTRCQLVPGTCVQVVGLSAY